MNLDATRVGHAEVQVEPILVCIGTRKLVLEAPLPFSCWQDVAQWGNLF